MNPSPAIAGSGWEQAVTDPVTVPVTERWPGKLRAYGNLGLWGGGPGWRLGMADRSVWLKWARKGGRGKKREAEEVSKVVASNRPWESVEEFLLGQ